MSRTLTTIILLSVFTLLVASCQEEKIPIVAEPFAQKPTIAKPALDLIDLSKMPPLGPKRMQSNTGDALGNKNRVVEDLIANGKDSIPFLINQLDDETKMEPTIMEFWYQLSVGDMAYITLTDFFTDETELKSTTSGFSWDEFLERGSDKASMSEEILRR